MASDWENVTPEQELTILIERLEAARSGIILATGCAGTDCGHAACVLRYLHQNGHRIVHLVPDVAKKSVEVPH